MGFIVTTADEPVMHNLLAVSNHMTQSWVSKANKPGCCSADISTNPARLMKRVTRTLLIVYGNPKDPDLKLSLSKEMNVLSRDNFILFTGSSFSKVLRHGA